MMSDNERLAHIERKIDRILSWAEGDSKLGTPSVKDQINSNAREIEEAKKKIIDLENNVRYNTDHIKDQKRVAGALGAGGGGILFAIIEFVRGLMGM